MQLVVEGDEELPGLRGGECLACGFVFFPYQPLGCERCGAFGARLKEKILPSRGRVCSYAAVQISSAPNLVVPYGVVEVSLDGGPTVRALAETTAQIAYGTIVVGILNSGVSGDADERFRFRAE